MAEEKITPGKKAARKRDYRIRGIKAASTTRRNELDVLREGVRQVLESIEALQEPSRQLRKLIRKNSH